MELREGQLVTPTLRLRRLLGQGGMGSVWVADHLALQTEVAVKFLSRDMVAAPEAVERFRREATAAAQIRSPHVVQTLDHGLTNERVPYIVLELLEGEELGKRMAREPHLPLGLVTLIVSQTCKALAKAHEKGIVHRDIKPENIFLVDVDGEPFIKVLDFGIAKQTSGAGQSLNMTSTNSMIGTPYYMSPEQAFSSKDVDARADLWALAIVAYFALTGDVPFDGETVGAICVSIDRAKFTPASQHRPDLPPTIDAWFARALARPLDERFRNAREMAESFVAASQGDEPPRSAAWSGPSLAPPSRPGSSSLPPSSLPVSVPASVAGALANGPAGARTNAGLTLPVAPARPRWPLALGAGAAVSVALIGYLVATTSKGQGPDSASARASAVSAAASGAPTATPLATAVVAPTATAAVTAATTATAVVAPTAATAATGASAPVVASASPAATVVGARPAGPGKAAAPTAPPATGRPVVPPNNPKVDRGF